MEEILEELWKSRHQKDALFLELIEGYTIKESKDYPNRIFYMKGESVLIDYNLKTKYAWINYELIWSIFESKFSLNYQEVKELMRGLLETHLKLEGTTVLFKYSTTNYY